MAAALGRPSASSRCRVLLRHFCLIVRINEFQRPRASGTYLNDSLLVRMDEVWCLRRHGDEGPGCVGLRLGRVELRAHADVELTGDDGDNLIDRVRVGW